MSAPELQRLAHEQWLAQRLGEHGAGVFTGLTDRDTRRERFRAAILEHGLEAVVVGRHEGKPQTYAQAFERLFGEALKQPQRVSASPKKSTTPAPSRLTQMARQPTQLTLGDHP
jgi:hypothetical protein